jgi:SAM-dependent methyltransferase
VKPRRHGGRWVRPVRLGSLRRTTPVSDRWGWDRGTPIDRHYIDAFLEEHRGDIRGRVLEVRDSRYTERFGSGVTQADVLDIDESNADATIVADLTATAELPAGLFDCFILAQTLQYIFDLEAAIRGAHRVLRPGGVVLATVPAVSRIARSAGIGGDYWRFTGASCRRLFSGAFGEENVAVRSFGNALTGAGFLMGLSVEDLSPEQLRLADEFFPVLIAVRASKA